MHLIGIRAGRMSFSNRTPQALWPTMQCTTKQCDGSARDGLGIWGVSGFINEHSTWLTAQKASHALWSAESLSAWLNTCVAAGSPPTHKASHALWVLKHTC